MARRILAIDDDQDVLDYVATVLRKEGYVVVEANDLADARTALLQGQFDAVVTDVNLPDGDGVSLIPFVGASRPVTRVVVATANATMQEAVRALRAGAYDFLAKPVNKDALLSAVRRAVEAKGLEQENEQLVLRLASRVHALRDMLDIAREVGGERELDVVLSRALDRMTSFFQAEAGSILLPVAEGRLRFAVVCGGPPPQDLLGMVLPKGAGIAGWAAERRRPLIVNDTRRDPRFSSVADEACGSSTRNVIACPLMHKGRLVGVLELVNAARGKFSREDRLAAETLAVSIAGAIENARAADELAKSRAALIDHSHLLEARVEERTLELSGKNRELADLNRRLEETRDQMVRAEKMASIGTIAAGVAHEINNPIGFINSNLQTLKGYLADIKPLIEEMRRLVPPSPELEARIKKVDLDFVLSDLDTLARESEDGVKRVVKIVRDLKTFSHTSKGPAEDIDVNACVEAALNLSRNEVKYVADVETDLVSLPKVSGWSTEITQVLVNLIVNAGHAIAGFGAPKGASAPKGHGTITVRSHVDDGAAVIEVSDTGCGIPRDIQSRIFDPFFTTKEPGKGTGLGLSLSWEIVERHHGELSVESEVGRGTTFRIRLPLAAGAALAPSAVAALLPARASA